MPNPQYPSGVTDTRSDLGYGTTRAKFHKPRSFNQYPEPEEDLEGEEEEVEASTFVSVASKLLNYKPVDHLSKYKSDPFYYVGSATKLSEISTAKGMVPFPRMYNQRQAAAGGTSTKYPTGPTSGFQSRSRPTGTKRGFSKSPYPDGKKDKSSFKIKDIINKNSDEDHIESLKSLIRMIHLEQESTT